MPTIRGRNQDDAASGTMPSRPKTKPIRAVVEASRRSMASVMVAPMPTAAPLIAAMTGLGSAWIASVTLPPVSRIAVVRLEVGAQLLGRRPQRLVEPEHVAVGGQVHPGAERPAGAGDDDRADRVVAGVGEEELAGARAPW